MAYLLLYVDDMILSASTTALLRNFITSLKTTFAVKDMGPVSYFLDIDVQWHADGFVLSQAAYANDILERAGMANCKAARRRLMRSPNLLALMEHPSRMPRGTAAWPAPSSISR
ncbi:uncharacterized mitochondrial protein AtMg00810-like [Panicum virgatum]|uniref:uncharacterized mitochondrial protein AtMg00810-like n=1 Tax=Panicum virgatum TaxID=38727 RepID=UPI0019D5796D|nr:uncharacterized mitochondrial protein AtMg00810-like [Panicum virgatum]